jgi:hypothetical protein
MRRVSDTLRPGDRAPEFTLQDAYGTAYSLEDLLAGAGTQVPAYEGQVPAYESQVPADESQVPADESKAPARERRAAHDSRLLLVFDRGTW